MRKLKLFFACLLMAVLSIGQMWGTATTVKWARVTSVSTLTSGGTFIMGYEATAKSGTIIPLRSADCNATTSANGYFNTGTTTNSTTNGTIDMSTVTSTSDYEVYISSPASGKINIQRATSSGNYYGASSGGSSKNTGRLYTSGNSNETNLTPEWASETNNQFKLTAGVSGQYKYLKYNTGSPRFAYYNSAGEKIVFYKKVTLSSISVYTAPTKTAYTEGESFAPAGLVIRKTWSDNSTEDIAYNNTTASDFTFSPSPLTTGTTSVTITYGGKSASQDITVAASGCDNKVTLATGNPSNGTISFSPAGPVETCDGSANVTMTITPNAGYYLSAYSPTGVSTSNTPSITTGTSATAAQTPTLTFAQNANGTYTAGATFTAFEDHFIDEVQSTTGYTGTGMVKSGNYSNSLPTISDKTVATTGNCQALHYHFVGWVLSDYKDSPIGHIATLNGHATGATYYAVWAKKGLEETNTISADLNTLKAAVSSISSGYASKTFEMSDGVNSYTFTADVTKNTQSATNGWMQVGKNTDSRRITITDELPGNITNISSTSIYNGSAGSYSGTVYYNTSTSTTDPIASKQLSSASSFSMDVTDGETGGYIMLSTAMCLGDLSVTYGTVSYTDYITVCCNELGSINGSVSMTQTTAALEWDDLDHVSSWAVQYKEHSAANWNTWNGAQSTANSKRSVTITNLSCGTAYDFKIAATAAAGYCDAEDVLEDQSTTKWNISYTLTNTVEKTAGPETGANACGEISATFSKNALYSFPAEITVTIGEVEATIDDDYLWDDSEGTLVIDATAVTGNVVVTIAGVAPPSPIISATPNELDFGEPKKGASVAAQSFALTGSNLTDANKVTVTAPTGFLVSIGEGSPAASLEITPSSGSVSATIIVTPVTTEAGDKSDFLTISSDDITDDVEVALYMDVQQTFTVNWYINGGVDPAHTQTDVANTAYDEVPSDFTSFTNCSPFTFVGWSESAFGSTASAPELAEIGTKITADKNYYAVFAEGTPGSTTNVFTESLSSGVSTTGWTFNNKCYTASSTVRLSTGDDPGVMTTPALTNLDGTATLIFEIKGWGGTKDEDGEVSLSASKGSFSTSSFTTSSYDDFEEVSTTLSGGDETTTITFTGTAGKRIYIKNVKVTQTTAPVWTNWYTTCPAIKVVALSAPEVSNGSISFEISGSSVDNVRTDGGADVDVDVVPDPATGYELTGVALSGVAGASYAAGVITIPQDAEGTLVATATFSQKNYSIAVETYPENIGATLGGATSAAKYGVEQTISTDEPTGYLFGGWYIYDAEDTEKETDLSNEIFTGTYAGGDLELSASFLMPDKNLVAEAYFDKIYTPAEALALDDLTDSVFVEGIISQVDEVSTQYKNATYWISADGTTSNQIKIYRGKHINKADVTVANAGQIAVGNKVIVRGKLSVSSNTNQFGQGASYIFDLTEKDLASLAIVGTPSVTAYDAGQNFDKTGLSLTATYNTGYVETNYTGTTITSDYDGENTFSGNGEVTVTVSAEKVNAALQNISTSREITVTVSNAVLDHVVISADAQTEFWAKEQYKEPLLDAYLTDEPATVLHNVTGVSNTTGLDMSVTGNKSVTVTYTRKVGQTDDVTYNFTVKPIAVDEANAHSVATARAIIDVDKTDGEDLDLELAATKTHVIGIVKSVTALSGNNEGKYTIVIKDQTDAAKEMTLYQVTLENGITSVEEGDLIKAYGNLYYHSQSSKYEINIGGQVVWKQPKVTITIADKTLEVGDVWTINPTIDPTGAANGVSYEVVTNENSCITLDEEEGVITATAEGTATIRISVAAYEEYLANEKVFTVTVNPAATHTNVVILAQYGENYYALGFDDDHALATIEVECIEGKIVVEDNEAKAALIWDRAERNGVATFYNVAESKYLNGADGTGLSAVTSTAAYTSWTWVETATKSYYSCKTNASTVRSFLYQSGQGIKNYAVSSIGSQNYAQANVLAANVVVGEITNLRENVSSSKYGTICWPKAGTLLNGALFEISYYDEASRKIFFDEIINGEMEAGKPYIFQPNEGVTVLKAATHGGATSTVADANGLIGSLANDNVEITAGDHNFILSNNQYWYVDQAGTAYVRPNCAYIHMTEIPTTPSQQSGAPRRRVSMGVNGVQTATGMDELNASETPVKVMIDGQLFIIRGEKMFNANGQLVK